MNYQSPFFNPYGFMQQYQQPQVQQPSQQVVKVNGRNGASQYALAPNSSAWILDESGLISWLIVSDGAGHKTVTAYDITPHQDVPAPDYGTLENRIARLEEIVNGNTKCTSSTRKKQPDDGAD